MKSATRSQEDKIVQMIRDKKVPVDKLQKLLGTNLLARLFDANPDEIDHEVVLRGLGFNAHPMIPEKLKWNEYRPLDELLRMGWDIESDVGFQSSDMENGLEVLEFLKFGEKRISAEETRNRAQANNAMLGLSHAHYLCKHHKRLLRPLKDFSYMDHIVFPGTVLVLPKDFVPSYKESRKVILVLRWTGCRIYFSHRWEINFWNLESHEAFGKFPELAGCGGGRSRLLRFKP